MLQKRYASIVKWLDLLSKKNLDSSPTRYRKVIFWRIRWRKLGSKEVDCSCNSVGSEILFSDEKIFTVETAHNHQNNRIWSKKPPLSDEIIARSLHPSSVMVWGGICSTGKTPLVFVDPGVRINKNYYLHKILQGVLKPWTKRHFKQRSWVF